MEFRLLGPLEVSDGARACSLGGPKQRTVLAHLILRANQVVPSDRLIEEVWGEDPPPAARSTLAGYLSHLRKAVGPGRLQSRSRGHVLVAEPSSIDAVRFEALVREGRAAGSADPAAAVAALERALGLWRGPALDDLADQASLQPDIARLEELRMGVVEDRIGAELDLGRHREVAPGLETLVAAHPFRERLWAHLMTALYRSGRQADALAAFQRAQDVLAEELGIDPSPELRRLHERILRQDPALEAAGEVLRGYRLLEQVGAGSFGSVHRAFQPQVGREVAVKTIHPRFVNHPEFIRRFEAEAQLVARLEHPHVVPLYDFWREPTGAYLVMRYLRGGSLRERLAHGPLAPHDATMLLDQLALALGAAHRQGVVHRDVKPANILFDEDDNAYLTDFGIAKDLEVAEVAAPGGSPSPLAYYLSPEEVRGEPVTPRTDIYSLGVVLHEILTGRHPFAEISPEEVIDKHLREPLPTIRRSRPDVPGAVDEVIARATAKHPAERYPDVQILASAFRAAVVPAAARPMAVPATEVRNPYKGLRPFVEADAPDFFGRESLVAELVTRLSDQGDGARFLAVVGPSGSGKSSAVRAGLLPALRRGAIAGSDRWFLVEMHPGAHPFEELAAALMRIAVHPSGDLLERLERDDEGLLSATAEILPPDSELLLVIDQFEEAFTLVGDEGVRTTFLRLLLGAASHPASRVRVVVTLRADFYDRPLSYGGLAELMKARTATVTPLVPEELERAVSGPAGRVGVGVDPALVAEIVADVAAQPGALPLLQYALTELFERRNSTLTLEAYRDIGGVSAALSRRAEGLYLRLNHAGKEATRQLFLRLLALGKDGTEDTRRRVLRSELTSLEVDGEAMEAVIETFGTMRLLSFDRDPASRGPTVEVAHEALLREWDRLRGWIEAAREDVRTHRRLVAAAREWIESERDPSFLLRGTQLARFEAWTGSSGLALTGDERGYLDASLERRSAEHAEEESRKAREAALERHSLVRLRALVAVLTALALVAGVLTTFAFSQRRQSAQQSVLSRARELVLFSNSVLGEDPELGALLALEAIDLAAAEREVVLPEAVDALHWALQGMRVQFPAQAPVAARSGPGGRRGVFALPVGELISFARSRLDRELTSQECHRYLYSETCPGRRDIGDVDRLTVLRPAGAGAPTSDRGQGPLAGTEVTVWHPDWDEAELAGWQAEVAHFRRLTGIRVVTEPTPTVDLDPTGAGVAADLVIRPTPSELPLWRPGVLMDLSAYLDMDQIRRDYAPYLLRLATVADDGTWPAESGNLAAGWVKLAAKSLIWYPVPEFEEAGYRIPQTWRELIILSDRLRSDGRSPWCFGTESGSSSGWIATDWVEDVLLRSAGPAVYDQWVAHEIPFTHPAVKRAVKMTGRIAFTQGYVTGGRESITRTPYFLAQDPMFKKPPGCWLHRQAAFAPAVWPEGNLPGLDAAAFPFPLVDLDVPPAMMGAGDLVLAFADRPEVRELVRFLLSPKFGQQWADRDTGGFMSPNLRFGLEHYASEVARLQARAARSALEADAFRFDGSDLMPVEVGSGAFWKGMTEYLETGPGNLDRVLEEIDAAWPKD